MHGISGNFEVTCVLHLRQRNLLGICAEHFLGLYISIYLQTWIVKHACFGRLEYALKPMGRKSGLIRRMSSMTDNVSLPVVVVWVTGQYSSSRSVLFPPQFLYFKVYSWSAHVPLLVTCLDPKGCRIPQMRLIGYTVHKFQKKKEVNPCLIIISGNKQAGTRLKFKPYSISCTCTYLLPYRKYTRNHSLLPQVWSFAPCRLLLRDGRFRKTHAHGGTMQEGGVQHL